MRKRLSAVVFFLACLTNCTALAAQPDLAGDADRIVSTYASGGRFLGAVLVARDGRIEFEHAYGMADVAWSVPNTVTAKFEVASLTKAFTAMAVAQLAAAGKLKLEDPVSKYYAKSPPSWEKITVDELLTHTSGLPNNEIKDFSKGITVPYTPTELIATFRERPLNFAPGTNWKYTNTEYYLLAYIIEKLSSMSYSEFLQQQIFTPLRMKDSGFAPTNAVVSQLAEGYKRDHGTLRRHDYFDRSLEIGAGGVHSTLADLLKWDEALYSEKLVPKPYLDRIFSANNKGNYGYGWFVEHRGGKMRIWHEGSDPGYAAFIIRRPQEHVLVVVLSNLEDAPVREIAEKLENLAIHDGNH
ncbi:MAG: serine hydrolase domain-containing protein [Terriglobales bacterium]